MRLADFDLRTMLDEAFYAVVDDIKGAPCRVWRNPSSAEFIAAVNSLDPGSTEVRAIFTQSGLYLWPARALTHEQLVQRLGFDGLRLGMTIERIRINLDAVASPEAFGWLYGAEIPPENDQREKVVETFLRSSAVITRLYHQTPAFIWYS